MARGPVVILSADLDTQDVYVSALRYARKLAYGFDSVEQAILVARETRLAAVVVDVRHDEDWEICHRLRRAPATRDTPIVVIGAGPSGDQRSRRLAAQSDCAALLSKRSLPSAVVDVLDRVARGERGIEVIEVG